MSIRGGIGVVWRKVRLLRRVVGWIDVFRSVNRVYYEVSVDQLAAEARRVTPPGSPQAEPAPSDPGGSSSDATPLGVRLRGAEDIGVDPERPGTNPECGDSRKPVP